MANAVLVFIGRVRNIDRIGKHMEQGIVRIERQYRAIVADHLIEAAFFFILIFGAVLVVGGNCHAAVLAEKGLPVHAVEALLTALTALSVVGCLHMMGIVLVISLLSVPQMTAGLFARTFGSMALLSIAFAVAGCLGGLLLSYWYNVPSGATIVLLSILIYFGSKAIKSLLSGLYGKSPA